MNVAHVNAFQADSNLGLRPPDNVLLVLVLEATKYELKLLLRHVHVILLMIVFSSQDANYSCQVEKDHLSKRESADGY